MTREAIRQAQLRALQALENAGIVVSPSEREQIEVADFGLNMLDRIGLQILVYVNTDRCCAKELIMTPGQICPEHRHPAIDGQPGKEETFRCRKGEVYLHVPGTATQFPRGTVPEGREGTFTVWQEIVLRPGEQYMLQPDVLHWFQAGPAGAIVSEFSTNSRDEADIFTDPEIRRIPQVEED